MAKKYVLTKPSSTNFRRLRILRDTPGIHTGIPDTGDSVYNTLVAGGAFVGPSSANVASPAGSTLVMDVTLFGIAYVPTSNSGPSVPANGVANVDFDGGTSAQFPLRPGDLVTIGKTANWAPKSGTTEGFVYADVLSAAGLVCIGTNVVGASTGTACRIQAVVMNLTASPVTVPAGWLPNIVITRVEA